MTAICKVITIFRESADIPHSLYTVTKVSCIIADMLFSGPSTVYDSLDPLPCFLPEATIMIFARSIKEILAEEW